jgi:hypothetical protein
LRAWTLRTSAAAGRDVSDAILWNVVVPLAVTAVVAAGAGLWVSRARRTGINPFDPASLDRLPSGVQEDDDVRFDWSAAEERGRFSPPR